eukprot:gene10584-12960_t
MKRPRQMPGPSSEALGVRPVCGRLPSALDHAFGNGDFPTLGIDDRAANGLLGLKRNDPAGGSAVLQAHGLSPHQVVRAV